MDLTQAEAVMDIINADNKLALAMARRQSNGMLSQSILNIKQMIVSLLALLGYYSDFDEGDDYEFDSADFIKSIDEIILLIDQELDNFDKGTIIREGVETVLAGKPNVGKSSVMNVLSRSEKSIVTEISGTTRDVVENVVRVGDIILKLSDTAGVHTVNDNIIEQIGIDKAKERIENATVILAVFDQSRPLDSDDYYLIKLLEDKRVIALLNKSDIKSPKFDRDFLTNRFEKCIDFSAKSLVGVDTLENTIKTMCGIDDITDSFVAINERHRALLLNAREHLTTTLEDIKFKVPLDFASAGVANAGALVAEITGDVISEDVVSDIFSHFCVGK
jgi:tRNA modification GTPase